MQDEKRYIVAVDLGSSHITGAVGHRDDDGRFTVDAVEIGESKDGIKRGRVINVSDVALKLSQIFRRLEARISPSKISKVYVGVSGQSIRSIEFPVVRTISSESPIDDSLLAELEAEARDRILENNLVVFDVIPGECRVDGRATEKPCGQYGSEIRVSYRLIVGNEIHKRNIDRVFEQAKMPIAGYICTANAAAVAVLSEEERRQGCALLDCGAETTTLSLYKDGYFASMITIPLGGNNITRDICSLHVKESEAESIKKAYQPQIDGTITVDWGMKDYYFDFTAEKIAEVIMARLGDYRQCQSAASRFGVYAFADVGHHAYWRRGFDERLENVVGKGNRSRCVPGYAFRCFVGSGNQRCRFGTGHRLVADGKRDMCGAACRREKRRNSCSRERTSTSASAGTSDFGY